MNKTTIDSLSCFFSKRINLLIVEDEPEILSWLGEIFLIPSINVAIAQTVDEARCLMDSANIKWHCWIIDMSLGDRKNAGLELIESHNHFPFSIVYSGIQSMECASRATKIGAAAVIDKGNKSIEKLIDAVCRIVPLAFILKKAAYKNKDVLFLLQDHVFLQPQEWADKAGISVRHLQRICALHDNIQPSFIIPFYYGMRLFLSSNLSGIGNLPKIEEHQFHEDCAKSLLENLAYYQNLR
jgi:ActR/RegA family two-component response regulator